MADQKVGGDAEGRIGRDARITVRAAAFRAPASGPQRLFGAHRLIHGRQHLLDDLDRGSMVLRVPPVCWMVMVRSSALGDLVMFEDRAIWLVSQPSPIIRDAAEIGMAGIALDGAGEDAIALPTWC